MDFQSTRNIKMIRKRGFAVLRGLWCFRCNIQLYKCIRGKVELCIQPFHTPEILHYGLLCKENFQLVHYVKLNYFLNIVQGKIRVTTGSFWSECKMWPCELVCETICRTISLCSSVTKLQCFDSNIFPL
jgi:hypothetical protein